MIKLDDNLLQELGLGEMPPAEKTRFLKHIYETLEMRVGVRLASNMTNEQLAEFEQFISANDEKGAFQWLEGNFPNYKDVVADEFQKLKGEISAIAPQILSAGQPPAEDAALPPEQPYQQPGPSPQPPYQQ